MTYLAPTEMNARNSRAAGAKIQNMMRDIAGGIQSRLNTLTGYSFTVTPKYAWIINYAPSSKHMAYALDKTNRGIDLVIDVNEGFWERWTTSAHSQVFGASTLVGAAGVRGCDAQFVMVSPYDPMWDYSNGIDAVANTMAMCGDESYGLVKANQDVDAMATLQAHELGHILGMMHDEPFDAAHYPCQHPVIATECGWVTGNCSDAINQNCADDSGSCVMVASVNGEETFSGCSAAYMTLYVKIASVAPQISTDCMVPQKKKRSLLERLVGVSIDENQFAGKPAMDRDVEDDVWVDLGGPFSKKRFAFADFINNQDIENLYNDISAHRSVS